MQKSDIDHTSGTLDRMVDGEDTWAFDGTVTAEEVATSGILDKLREMQRVCENGCGAVLTTIVEVIEVTCEGV